MFKLSKMNIVICYFVLSEPNRNSQLKKIIFIPSNQFHSE
jgi:hypothetical protein